LFSVEPIAARCLFLHVCFFVVIRNHYRCGSWLICFRSVTPSVLALDLGQAQRLALIQTRVSLRRLLSESCLCFLIHVLLALACAGIRSRRLFFA
jgi:hypothetical protein